MVFLLWDWGDGRLNGTQESLMVASNEVILVVPVYDLTGVHRIVFSIVEVIVERLAGEPTFDHAVVSNLRRNLGVHREVREVQQVFAGQDAALFIVEIP